MDGILFIRIMITLTFLILAVCGPIAIIQIRRFIKVYMVSHAALIARVTALEKALNIKPGEPLQ
jgi:hypothetical protein